MNTLKQMMRARLFAIPLVTSPLICLAQTASPEPPYSVVDRGPFYSVLERTVSVTNTTGEVSQQLQSYTVLGDGMNYLSNGQWVDAQDLVEVTPTGAAAVHGQMVAAFNSDISSTGAISLTNAAGEVFQSHPIGLFYADSASGKVAQISAVQSSTRISIGTLYPPNVIVFSNLLAGLRSQLMLVWAKNGFEQNLVLQQSPPVPESFGLSSSSTTLQFWTAMDSCSVPQEQRPVLLGSGLEDHILFFAGSWFPIGGAFSFGNTPLPPSGQAAQIRVMRTSDPGVVPVAKSLENIAGQLVLIEQVKYTDLAPALSQLPTASISPKPSQTVELAERATFLATPPKAPSAHRPMELASASYAPAGVVLDYMNLSGSANSFTFTNGSTYHIASSFSVGPGTATFQQNSCVKLDTNAYLLVSGNVSCSSSGSPTVFTSRDDNYYGAIITNSTANPGYAAAEAIWMYAQTFQTTLQNVRVRWAQNGIEYSGCTASQFLNSSSLEDSIIGIMENMGTQTLYLTQVTSCNVQTPVDGYYTSGTVTTNCGVVSVAMVNDPNRDATGLDTNKNSQSECSFAVLDSTNIVAAFMNTHLSEYELGTYGPEFSGIASPRMTSWAISTNAGMNFTDKGPILPISTITNGTTVITNGASDPMHGDAGDTTMAYDSVSNVVYLLVNTSRETTNYYGFRLWTSADKGQSFNPVNMDVPGLDTNGNHLISSSDKPMIKVNSTNHNLYVAGSVSGNNTWAARSTNGGNTWTNYQQLESTGTDSRGADIIIVADGTVYVFWLRGWGTTNQLRYAWLSTNNVWSSSTSIGPSLNSPNGNASGNLLRSSGAGSNDYFLDNGFPRVAYANGNIYIVYADLPSPGSTADRGDIFLVEAAVNWGNHTLSVTSGPRKVNNDRTATDQWDPSIAASLTGSELFIGYYSRQNDPANNSKIMAYGAKGYITNGLASATFDCFPISLTNSLPLFAGTNAIPSNVRTFDPVWPAAGACFDSNDAYTGYTNGSGLCLGGVLPTGTQDDLVHFCADDYTWCAADSNYFYFAWCDRSRTYQGTRPDADVELAKIKQ